MGRSRTSASCATRPRNASKGRFAATIAAMSQPVAPSDQPLNGREIIVGVCGGIAAYKVADVVSKLVQAGAGVTVVMTAEAQKFVTPLTFEALSGRKVHGDIFAQTEPGDTQHIGLS